MSTIARQNPLQAEPARAYGPIVGIGLVTALFCWVFSDFLLRQVRWAIDFPSDWGHTLAMPLIAGYFVYLQRDKLLAQPFKTAWVGLIPLILGMALYSLCIFGPSTLHNHNLHGAGFSIALFGLALLLFGFRAMTYLWFPLAYVCVFGQAISDRIMHLVTFKMQDVAARGSYYGLMLLGLDLDLNGNTITIFHMGKELPLNIAEACSGMRMLMAFLALGVAMAFTGLPRLWQRVALVILALPTAIFVNILRVMTLGLLSMVDSGLAAGDFHSFIGLLWLLPAFMIYLGVMWILRKLVVEEEDVSRPASAAVRSTEPAAS